MKPQSASSATSSVFCSFWYAATSSILRCKRRLLFLLAWSHKQLLQLPAAFSVPSGLQPQSAPSFFFPVVPLPATLPSLESIVTVYTQVKYTPVISVLIAVNELAIQYQQGKTAHVTIMWLSLRNASINTPQKTGHAIACHLSLSPVQLVSYVMATLLIGVCLCHFVLHTVIQYTIVRGSCLEENHSALFG